MTEIASHSDETRPTVLIIDDSADVHRLLKVRLKHEEIDFLSAERGAPGIQLARDHRPTLVLLDLDMPEMDGFQVLRALKDHNETQHIPVIVLSGQQSPQDKVTAFELGAVDYITKPFEFTELRVRVRSALRMHQLVQMLAQKAQIDGLTGLWNRTYFDNRWTEEHARATRHGHPISVAVLDVDHFKSVNDTFGHPAGDAVLQGLAKIARREARNTDLACRYGGEEFVLIMPDTRAHEAEILLERVRAAVEATVWPRHPQRTVTISVGIVGATGVTPASAAEWIEAADRNLYAAKHGGRNRVVTTDLSVCLPGFIARQK